MSERRFITYMLEEPERFLSYPFKNEIKDFNDFRESFKKEFITPSEYNDDDLIQLFETPECKNRMRRNTTDKEFEKLYGDGIKVERFSVSRHEIVTISYPKIKSPSYIRNNKPVKSYERFKPKKFTSVETKFIKVRKMKKIPSKQIIKDYNKHFKEKGRSESSIKSKVYRL